MTDPTVPHPDLDREIPYLLCKDCGTPCYVFEVEMGRITEALCVACGNDAVQMFTIAEWDDEEG